MYMYIIYIYLYYTRGGEPPNQFQHPLANGQCGDGLHLPGGEPQANWEFAKKQQTPPQQRHQQQPQQQQQQQQQRQQQHQQQE